MVGRRSAQDFVRCPESGSVRFSEVANIYYSYGIFNP